MNHIFKWHVPIMGFAESKRKLSGTERLWLKMRKTSAVAPRSSLIPPQHWRADFKGLAAFIARNSIPTATVNIYAYSWGCGHGFLKFAHELRRQKIEIDTAVLCDPVYHSWARPWRGLCSGKYNPPIVIPSNVRNVHWLYQRENTPQATMLTRSSSGTEINESVRCYLPHGEIDDSEQYHAIALRVAQGQ